MTDKYKNRYRIQSHRMPDWDYSGDGMYFITLVTQNRECNLGEILNKEMILSDWGEIVNDEWLKSFDMRHELFCDEYVIMPNHLHAIVVINKSTNNLPPMDDSDAVGGSVMDGVDGTGGTDGMHGTDGTDGTHVETHGRASLRAYQSNQSNQSNESNESNESKSGNSGFSRKPQSISSFVGGFKSAINSKIDDYIDEHQLDISKYNRNNHFFQPNYHDHIIRNDAEYQRIKQYIIDNPKNWNGDTFNRIGQ